MRFLLPILVLVISCAPPASPPPQMADDWSALTLTEDPSVGSPATLDNLQGWERKNAAFYHVWVAAFADSNGDGTGDLAGITTRIDDGYFTDLGVNGLWLSPIFEASSLTAGSANKHGYDITNYDQVDSLFGSKDDLKTLLEHAHVRGIRVIFDFVPNHTSSQHPWFAAKKSWYVTSPSQPSGWGGFDASNDWYSYPGGGYYYGVFYSEMPDLNYRNRAVRDEMASVVARWLNFGFDGLRVDAVKYLVEGSSPDQWKDQPETYLWFQALRKSVLDPYSALGSAKFMVAENWESNVANLSSYLVKDGKPAFALTFDFDWPSWVAQSLSGAGADDKSNLEWALVTRPNLLPSGTAFGTFQSNHDNVASRPATSYAGAGQGPKLFLAAGLSLLGKGTPFVYYGNEIGMTGQAGSDINLRQPFDWTRADAQRADADSLWSWHSALLRLRAASPAWDDPAIATAASPAGTLAWLVTGATGKRVLVVANLKDTAASVTVSGLGNVSLAKTVLGAGQPAQGSGILTFTSLPAFGLRAVALDEADPLVVRSTDGDGTVYQPVPVVYPTLYLRGTMNAWGITSLLSSGGGVFHQTFSQGEAAEVKFKFASSDWGTALGYDSLVLDASKSSLAAEAFSTDNDLNVVFSAEAATYDLGIDTSVNPPLFWVIKL